MSQIKLAIFDMDGTLLDSMPYWDHLGRYYLEARGIQVPETFESTIISMTLEEGGQYMKDEFHLEETVEEIIKGVLSRIEMAYQFEIPAKAGMKQLLMELKQAGTKMVVLTTSDKKLAKAALKRTGLLSFFEEVHTASELKMGKRTPEIYYKVCEMYGAEPKETMVYEDAVFAIKAAVEAGCQVTAVYDEAMKDSWNEISTIANHQIYSS